MNHKLLESLLLRSSQRGGMAGLSLVAAVQLVGCASMESGQKFVAIEEPSSHQAAIHVYRANTFVGGGRDASFAINDVWVFDLPRDSYSVVLVPEGSYRLKHMWKPLLFKSSDAKLLEVPVNAVAGRAQYFKFSTGSCYAGYREVCSEWTLRPVSEEQAKLEMQNMHVQHSLDGKSVREALRSNEKLP